MGDTSQDKLDEIRARQSPQGQEGGGNGDQGGNGGDQGGNGGDQGGNGDQGREPDRSRRQHIHIGAGTTLDQIQHAAVEGLRVFVNDSSSVFPEPPLNIEIMFSQVVNNERSTLVTMTMALAHQE